MVSDTVMPPVSVGLQCLFTKGERDDREKVCWLGGGVGAFVFQRIKKRFA